MLCGSGDKNLPVYGFIRIQFSNRTYFALITSEAQGESFGGRISLVMREHCFSHSQLKIALLRKSPPCHLTILTRESNQITRNVLYPEVLQ